MSLDPEGVWTYIPYLFQVLQCRRLQSLWLTESWAPEANQPTNQIRSRFSWHIKSYTVFYSCLSLSLSHPWHRKNGWQTLAKSILANSVLSFLKKMDLQMADSPHLSCAVQGGSWINRFPPAKGRSHFGQIRRVKPKGITTRHWKYPIGVACIVRQGVFDLM